MKTKTKTKSPSLTFGSPSLTFEEAGCLKKHPATSKGGRPHSDIVSDFKAYQTKQFSRDIWCNSTITIVPLVSTAFLLLASVIAGEDRKAFLKTILILGDSSSFLPGEKAGTFTNL